MQPHNPLMPSIAASLIEAHREEIARLRAQARVRRLDAFGSVVRADFSSERSLRNPWLRRRVEAERVPVYAS